MALEVNIQKKMGNFSLNVQLNIDDSTTCLGLLGASGCGKSMTLKCIAGIEKPDEGQIVLDGNVLFDSAQKINLPSQKRNIGYLFQNYALFPTMTVEENIGAGVKMKDKVQKKAWISQWIRRFHLEGCEKKLPGQLSGGQQQRVALARMLAARPQMILLDEPFSALDTHLKDAMQREMSELIREYEGHILLVSHSRDEIYRLSTQLAVMDRGRIEINGDTKMVFDRPKRVQVARLTGCKNISQIAKLDENHLFALDWGITFETAEAVGDNISHIGIRAHHFLPCEETDMMPNKFHYVLADIVEAPFEIQYFVRNQEDKMPLWWKVNKQDVNEAPMEVREGWLWLPPECVMMLE